MLPRNEGVRPEENTFHFIYGTRGEEEWWGGMRNNKNKKIYVIIQIILLQAEGSWEKH